MEAHAQDKHAFDPDIDVQHPQQRTASTRKLNNKRHHRHTTLPPHRRQRMNADGGKLVSKAACVVLDTRVILGALLGWSFVSKVLKRWNNNKTEEEEEKAVSITARTADYSRTPHASKLETEVTSLKRSLQNIRADNLVLAAQVAQLHGRMIGGHNSSQRSAGPKALNDAFEAAAAAVTRTEPSSSDRNTALVDENQEIKALECILDSRNEENNDKNKRDAAEVLLLQQENEQLRLALEHLRLENEEMAERMLEVAFTGTADGPIYDEPLESSDLNQLGELRNALISEAGGVLKTEEEEEDVVLWLEVGSKAGKNGDDIPNSSLFGGPTTPELAHEGGEASGSHQRRHIPAAAYLED
ncbi:hypothetical protein Ndes2526A_g03585 [Nannochloris sp. 'desiccata']